MLNIRSMYIFLSNGSQPNCIAEARVDRLKPNTFKQNVKQISIDSVNQRTIISSLEKFIRTVTKKPGGKQLKHERFF